MISLSFPDCGSGKSAMKGPFEGGAVPRPAKIVHTYGNPHWFYSHHAHAHMAELIYVTGGEGTYTIDDVPYRVHAGSIVVINANVTHAVLSDKDAPLDAFNLGLSGFSVAGLAPACLIGPDILPLAEADDAQAALFDAGMRQILALRQVGGAYELAACEALAAALAAQAIVLFADAPRIVAARTDAASVLAHDVLVYLSEHYREPITLASLAAHFNVSASAIGHATKARYGVSPIDHLIDCRLTASLWLLISTDLPVAAVACQVGFNGARHFSSLFTRRVGVPPVRFRASYRE